MRPGARPAAVTARNEATSGSLIWVSCAPPRELRSSRAARRAEARALRGRRPAPAGGSRPKRPSLLLPLLLFLFLFLFVHDVAAHRRQRGEELALVLLRGPFSSSASLRSSTTASNCASATPIPLCASFMSLPLHWHGPPASWQICSAIICLKWPSPSLFFLKNLLTRGSATRFFEKISAIASTPSLPPEALVERADGRGGIDRLGGDRRRRRPASLTFGSKTGRPAASWSRRRRRTRARGGRHKREGRRTGLC